MAESWSNLAMCGWTDLPRLQREVAGVRPNFGHRRTRGSNVKKARRAAGKRNEAFLNPGKCEFESLQLELRLTPFGHLGVFPEQIANWQWLVNCASRKPKPFKLLNLFAYTGGATLAAALAGAEVVHVDSAQNIVASAHRNADHSHLAQGHCSLDR